MQVNIDSVLLHTVLAMYEQENVRNIEPPNYSNTQLQSPERKSWQRSGNEESKKEKSQRGEESGSSISGKQLDSVRKETHVVSVTMEHLETDAVKDIVFSCTKSADPDWRKETIKRFRPQRGKSFWNRRPTCVPKFLLVKVYESVV